MAMVLDQQLSPRADNTAELDPLGPFRTDEAQFMSFLADLDDNCAFDSLQVTPNGVCEPAPTAVRTDALVDQASVPAAADTAPARTRTRNVSCAAFGDTPRSDTKRSWPLQGEVCGLMDLPTASDIKKEKLRAKNRRNQKKYRDRLKVQQQTLETELDIKTKRFNELRERWRRLRLENRSLQERAKLTQVPSHQASPSSSTSTEPGQSSKNSVFENSQRKTASSGCSEPRQGSHTAPREVSSPCGSQMVTLSPQSPFNRCEQSAASPRRAISSYVAHEEISFAVISQHMAPRELLRNSCHFNVIPRAAKDYQRTVAQSLRLPVDEICWFMQWPYPGVHPAISFSTGCASVECNVSASLCMQAIGIESLFLVMHHEVLHAAQDPFYQRPAHPCMDSLSATSAPPPLPPNPPDPGILSRSFVTCGVNQRMRLNDAINATFKPLLSKYRATLPRSCWRAVCMQVMHKHQNIAESLSKRMHELETKNSQSVGSNMHVPEDSAECSAEESDGGIHTEAPQKGSCKMSWDDLNGALLVANQLLLGLTYDALCDSSDMARSNQMEGDTLGQVEQRMFELMGTNQTYASLALQAEPVLARSVLVTKFLGDCKSIVRGQRLHMKLFKQMQLEPDQVAAMAVRWTTYCRRRHALGRQLSETLTHLLDKLPSRNSIPYTLVRIIHAHTYDSSTSGHSTRSVFAANLPEGSRSMHTSSYASVHDAQNTAEEEHLENPSSTFMHATNASTIHDHDGGSGRGCMHKTKDVVVQISASVVLGANGTCIDENQLEGYEEASRQVDSLNTVPTQLFSSLCVKRLSSGQNEGFQNGKSDSDFELGFGRVGLHPTPHAATSCMGSGQPETTAATTPMHRYNMHAVNACPFEDQHNKLQGGACVVEQHTCPACMMCERGMGGLLLGESGEVVTGVEHALKELLAVHESDGLMHLEMMPPFWELTEAQHALIYASRVDLGLSAPDFAGLWKAAADQKRQEELFGPLDSFW